MAHATSLPPLSSGRKLGEKFEILGVYPADPYRAKAGRA